MIMVLLVKRIMVVLSGLELKIININISFILHIIFIIIKYYVIVRRNNREIDIKD